MNTLEFVNYVLSLIGEQPLLSTAGNLGQLVRNAIYSSTLSIVQTTRASFFEQFITGTATNVDYLVPALVLPEETIQVLEVAIVDISGDVITLQQLPHSQMLYYPAYTYDIVGNKLYLSKTVDRPINIRVRALVLPTVPTADDAPVGIPKPIQPAIAHGAASILCLTYVDDSNAAAQHKNIADEMSLMLRQQFGITRGRVFNMSNTRDTYYV